ncbi:MAG: hypothetical protein K9N00_00420 [Candidatus Marinimicrobia bacterium]|nr:hypothetical protein [Candidatus Neomarinimicrobiota bacterium]
MHTILENIEPDYNIDIKMFDTREPDNIKLLQKLAEKYNSPMGIPNICWSTYTGIKNKKEKQ